MISLCKYTRYMLVWLLRVWVSSSHWYTIFTPILHRRVIWLNIINVKQLSRPCTSLEFKAKLKNSQHIVFWCFCTDGIEAVCHIFQLSENLTYLPLAELNLFVGQLTPRQKADSAVCHALAVQRAQAMGNYHSLFDLYLTAPNMGAYIMDHFIDRERIRALMVVTKACVVF